MRIILSIILCSVIQFSFAQDDIPEYRSKKDNFLKMVEKDIRSDLSQFTFGGISRVLPSISWMQFRLLGQKMMR